MGSKAEGHDYLNDTDYNSGYEKMFDKQFTKYYNKETVKEMLSNPSFKKAQDLCKEYGMESFDDLARENAECIREMRKYLD